jgi:ABC-type phosphate/phosphonate transport system permease subunit
MEKILHFKPIKIAIFLLVAAMIAETLGITRDPAGNPIRFLSNFFNSLFASDISNWLGSVDRFVFSILLLISVAIIIILRSIITALEK